jgi:hypothetical protein
MKLGQIGLPQKDAKASLIHTGALARCYTEEEISEPF